MELNVSVRKCQSWCSSTVTPTSSRGYVVWIVNRCDGGVTATNCFVQVANKTLVEQANLENRWCHHSSLVSWKHDERTYLDFHNSTVCTSPLPCPWRQQSAPRYNTSIDIRSFEAWDGRADCQGLGVCSIILAVARSRTIHMDKRTKKPFCWRFCQWSGQPFLSSGFAGSTRTRRTVAPAMVTSTVNDADGRCLFCNAKSLEQHHIGLRLREIYYGVHGRRLPFYY